MTDLFALLHSGQFEELAKALEAQGRHKEAAGVREGARKVHERKIDYREVCLGAWSVNDSALSHEWNEALKRGPGALDDVIRDLCESGEVADWGATVGTAQVDRRGTFLVRTYCGRRRAHDKRGARFAHCKACEKASQRTASVIANYIQDLAAMAKAKEQPKQWGKR